MIECIQFITFTETSSQLEMVDIFGIRPDRLLQLLYSKARMEGGDKDVLIPCYVSELFEAMEKGDDSVCVI